MSIFVLATDELTITFFVGKSKNGDIYCDPEEASLKEVNEDLDHTTIEQHSCTFRRPCYEDSVSFADGAMEVVGGEVRLNPARADMKRITTLLKSWSFKDDTGKPIPVEPHIISSLAPEVGTVIAFLLNKKI